MDRDSGQDFPEAQSGEFGDTGGRQKKAKAASRAERKGDLDPGTVLEISRSLKKRMQDILKKDNANNLEGRPATGKIENVEEISDILMSKALQESLLDEGILDEIKGWLEPLPDKSMPNIKIRKRLLDVLKTMKIHKEHLVTSGVGKIVYFYSINPKESKEVRASAKALVQKWTNEVFKPEGGD
ncbi:hypothetical protein [Encephalitozoon cuniculi GB-M1]|uniref:TFIIS N-terminal domain-containing protein n=1 Tax=Encephalitozoon cuniculi (strain GB-M1) TaxID=284813 RepID=Q8SUS7_ENCCU|nr:Spn1p-like protein [Encephalitozoon cuniculi GB-M1]KMV65571.1 hypothetical protein M970_080410 [Encephalitozoon cuniculi EcunIII-L]UYI26970.1 transcription factor Iws1 [Encephalitozoon cuniculi]CAD26349.2 hypothetical protein [Encephalitozoon cuniculi GB-M1]